MTEIKVGDKVQWWEEFKGTPKNKRKPRTLVGVVTSVHESRKPWAGVRLDADTGLSGTWVRDLKVLTVVAPVAYPVPQANQGSADMLAVLPDPSEILIEADILALMRWAGSGAEL